MKVYHLIQTQFIPKPLDEVWDYFATPQNLDEMTPAEMHFEILSGGNQPMYPGQLIEYDLTLLPGIKIHWVTEIAHVEEKVRFIDEQRAGPYRFWYHEHYFQSVPGGTMMRDSVTYMLPFGFLGSIAHLIFVSPQLKKIFQYRYHKVKEVFGETKNESLNSETLPN